MKILIDTCIWSLAYRRKNPDPSIKQTLSQLARRDKALIIGAIRQELLSGISNKNVFYELQYILSTFPNTPTVQEDYELAAEYFNICRTKGVQGSLPDFLLCAVAFRLGLPIFTTDQDFTLYEKHLPITLFHPA